MFYMTFRTEIYFQRLAGATLLVFSNKQDLPGALKPEEIKDVSTGMWLIYTTKSRREL